MGFDNIQGKSSLVDISGKADIDNPIDKKHSDENFKGRRVSEKSIAPYTDKKGGGKIVGKRVNQFSISALKAEVCSILSTITGCISCATSDAVNELARQKKRDPASEDFIAKELTAKDLINDDKTLIKQPEPSKIRLSKMLSLDYIRVRVLADSKKEHLSRIQNTLVQPELIGDGFKLRIGEGEYLRVPPSSIYIGPDDGSGIVTSFPSGINEKIVKMDSGQNAVVHKDGRYIILNATDAVKGFEDTWYGVIGDKPFTGDPGKVCVIYDGVAHFVSVVLGEQVKHAPGKVLLVCIDGRVKELCSGDTEYGFFDNAYSLSSMGTVKTAQWEGKSDDLQEGLDVLNAVRTPEEAKLNLNELFQSKGGRELLFRGNGYLINREGLLEFIELYHNAIALESKEKPAVNRTHKKKREKKKKQRLSAIKQVKQFVKELNAFDPEYEEKLFCCVQMLGRIREPNMVKNYRMPMPNGFSLLQAGWAKNPLKMVQIIIELLNSSDKSCVLDTQVPGCEKEFKVSEDYSSRDYLESYADSLIIAALYNVKLNEVHGSTRSQDGLLARYMGLSVKQAKERRVLSKSENKTREVFLNDMCDATNENISILATINKDLEHFVNIYVYKNTFFSGKQHKVVQYVSPKRKINLDAYYGDYGMPVLISKFERKKERGENFVSFKLSTKEGQVLHIKMKQNDFIKNFDSTNCLLLGEDSDKEFNSFEDIGTL